MSLYQIFMELLKDVRVISAEWDTDGSRLVERNCNSIKMKSLWNKIIWRILQAKLDNHLFCVIAQVREHIEELLKKEIGKWYI